MSESWADLADTFRRRSVTPGLGQIIDITELAPSPTGGRIAFTGTVQNTADEPAHTAVYLVDVSSGRVTEIGGSGSAAWSADGALLAYIDGPSTVTVLRSATDERRTFTLPGTVEYLRFAANSPLILAGVADAGADRSGAQGSGGVHEIHHPSAVPYVEGGRGSAGWRRVVSIDTERVCAQDSVVRLSAERCAIWGADWCLGGVVAIASDLPDEGSWYRARIVRFDGPDEEPTVVVSSECQLGLLSVSPDGRAAAFVEAICSDRGVIAGDAKILDVHTGTVVAIDSAGVDVSSLTWRNDATLLASGQRHLDTVVAEVGRDGSWRELWSSGERSCGSWYPNAVPVHAGDPNAFLATFHAYGQPPALTLVSSSGERVILDTAHAGTQYLREVGGSLTAVTWPAPDGLEIEGLLATPDSAGPHPLVMLIHGGPVAAYRPSWQLIYGWTPLLVAAGYAVLHPNPRGSGGRGQLFASLVRGDMGGDDTADFTSAADALAARGIIDIDRVAVTGRSYGGYMSSWLITQVGRFAAAIPMAPVANWLSQHFTSNLGAFDETFLGDVVTNPAGKFFSRSPVFFAGQVRTPVLNIAGGQDKCTPPSQAIEFHRALIERGLDSTLVVYPSEGHHIESPAAVADLHQRMLAFLAEHLGVTAPRSD